MNKEASRQSFTTLGKNNNISIVITKPAAPTATTSVASNHNQTRSRGGIRSNSRACATYKTSFHSNEKVSISCRQLSTTLPRDSRSSSNSTSQNQWRRKLASGSSLDVFDEHINQWRAARVTTISSNCLYIQYKANQIQSQSGVVSNRKGISFTKSSNGLQPPNSKRFESIYCEHWRADLKKNDCVEYGRIKGKKINFNIKKIDYNISLELSKFVPKSKWNIGRVSSIIDYDYITLELSGIIIIKQRELEWCHVITLMLRTNYL